MAGGRRGEGRKGCGQRRRQGGGKEEAKRQGGGKEDARRSKEEAKRRQGGGGSGGTLQENEGVVVLPQVQPRQHLHRRRREISMFAINTSASIAINESASIGICFNNRRRHSRPVELWRREKAAMRSAAAWDGSSIYLPDGSHAASALRIPLQLLRHLTETPH
eukprot:1065862-Rhodomonas_salina.2